MASISRFPDGTMHEVDRDDGLGPSRGILLALSAVMLVGFVIVVALMLWLG